MADSESSKLSKSLVEFHKKDGSFVLEKKSDESSKED